MYSSIVLGILAILYGLIQLGTHISLKVIWIGLIVYGAVKLFEGYPRVLLVIHERRPAPQQ